MLLYIADTRGREVLKIHMSLTEGAVTGQFLCATCLATFKSVALQLHEQGCYTAMGLQATHKTATEEDRGEDNKDPDWLMEQSIARQVAGGVVTRCNGDWKLWKVELSSTSCSAARYKNVARQVAGVTCYTVQFFSNLCRNAETSCWENCAVEAQTVSPNLKMDGC